MHLFLSVSFSMYLFTLLVYTSLTLCIRNIDLLLLEKQVYKDAFLCFDASWRDIYMLENGADVNFPAISAWSSNIKTVSDSGAGTVSYR